MILQLQQMVVGAAELQRYKMGEAFYWTLKKDDTGYSTRSLENESTYTFSTYPYVMGIAHQLLDLRMHVEPL